MHTLPDSNGEALSIALQGAAVKSGIDLLTSACVTDLFVADDDEVKGMTIVRPDGCKEVVGCARLILACNGYGGDADLVRRHLPETPAIPAMLSNGPANCPATACCRPSPAAIAPAGMRSWTMRLDHDDE